MDHIALATNSYGKYLHKADDFGKRVESSTMHRSNPSFLIGCIQLAVDQFMDGSFVTMEENVALIRCCFGRVGSLARTLSEKDDVLGAVLAHRGLIPFDINTDSVSLRVLVLSGGDDDSHALMCS